MDFVAFRQGPPEYTSRRACRASYCDLGAVSDYIGVMKQKLVPLVVAIEQEGGSLNCLTD